MMAYSAAKQYKKNQIETASPKQLVILLYEGAIKYIRLSELALEKRLQQGQHQLAKSTGYRNGTDGVFKSSGRSERDRKRPGSNV